MQATIGYLLAQLCKAHRNAVNERLTEAGLHVGQEMVLCHLWEQDGQTQAELAATLCVEAPTVTRMLQRMERAELIERRSDPDDARVSRVYVTAQGQNVQGTVESVWQELEARLLADVTVEERLLLRRLLLQMVNNLTHT